MRARRSSDKLGAERPLILNPCGKIDPMHHLKFGDDGDVSPRIASNGRPSPYGEATIRILALQRPGLIIERRKRAVRVLGELGLIEDEQEEAARSVSALRRQGKRLKFLATYLEPSEPYLALTRGLIEREQPGLLKILPHIIRKLDTLMPEQAKPPRRPTQAGNLTATEPRARNEVGYGEQERQQTRRFARQAASADQRPWAGSSQASRTP